MIYLTAGSSPLDTLPKVELESYQGQWYEIARTKNSYQDNQKIISSIEFGPAKNTTAVYGLGEHGTISIKNTAVRFSASNEPKIDSVTGTALIVPGSNQRRLKIAFGNFFFDCLQRTFTLGGADYWIYALGPTDNEDLYSWAIISGPKKSFAYVLGRKPKLDNLEFQQVEKIMSELQLPFESLTFHQIESLVQKP